MSSKLFLTKLNIWTKIYSTNRLIHKIKQNFENKSQLNLWYSSVNKKLSIDCKNEGPLRVSKRGLSGDQGSDEDPDRDRNDKHLMVFKPVIFPNLWYKWKNFITINTIIRPFFDNNFNLNDFMFGAKQALVRISNCLADGDIQSVKELITEEAFHEMQRNFSLMNNNERNELRVDFEDIILSFVYRIGIIMNDDDKRWVEITVVYYCLYKYKSLIESKQLSFEEFREKFGRKITLCNYRFIREYTKGVESEWTVNLLGHFKSFAPF